MSESLRKTKRRVLLAMLGSSAASLAFLTGSASQAQTTRPSSRLKNVRNRTVVSLANLPAQRVQRVQPAARRLTADDFQALASYNFTSRTRNLTFREYSSLVQELENQYGASSSIAAVGGTATGACCCCCTCCCGPICIGANCEIDIEESNS